MLSDKTDGENQKALPPKSINDKKGVAGLSRTMLKENKEESVENL
tara:strand:+ start:381 stop:515 length:135 start_codon:yes stop_codon:yes gene_type:complete